MLRPRSEVRHRRRLSVATACGILAASLAVVCVAWLAVSLVGSQLHANRASACRQHLRLLARGMALYALDWDERLPLAGSWGAAVREHLSSPEASDAFRCPSSSSPFGYAFNSAVSGIRLTSTSPPSRVVVLFECDARSLNTSGGRDLLVRAPRHAIDYYLYADLDVGHTMYRNSVIWDPANASRDTPR
ncbi:MAG: hypothetical protein FJX72_22010 [Armatimonadetes bacterium]|nr:hypothetical protein [Armatimonadota bacterium]